MTPFDRERNRYTATLQNLQPSLLCPGCGTASTRVRSRYLRVPADLPVAEARRFFCEDRDCPRQTFSGFLARFVSADTVLRTLH